MVNRKTVEVDANTIDLNNKSENLLPMITAFRDFDRLPSSEVELVVSKPNYHLLRCKTKYLFVSSVFQFTVIFSFV